MDLSILLKQLAGETPTTKPKSLIIREIAKAYSQATSKEKEQIEESISAELTNSQYVAQRTAFEFLVTTELASQGVCNDVKKFIAENQDFADEVRTELLKNKRIPLFAW